MEIKIFDTLPNDALKIRLEVFEREQNTPDGVDEIDSLATHLVLYGDGQAIATCRISKTENEGVYLIGRIAVIRELRGQGIGKIIISHAEKYLQKTDCKIAIIRSRYQVKDFYARCGYEICSDIVYEGERPYIWVKKSILK
ncbi:MAG: GNAT family N-acetyltransferase [Clostridia bacterium]|nr:GNAT family N-acetyltransferase [Clostridia bacterium]